MKLAIGLSMSTVFLGSPVQAAQTQVNFILNNIGGVDQGSNAYIGFYNAADFWSKHLTTSQPVTVNLNVGFSSLGANILGSTGSTFVSKAIVNVENRILARQSGVLDSNTVLPTLRDGFFGAKDAVNVNTPGYTGSDVNGPYGIDNSSVVYDTDSSYNNSVIGLTTANAKALGYAFAAGSPDATINFSSDFAFDFNPNDGITAGQSDFIAVAIHEIGHALGFVSGVDDYDVLGTGGPAAGLDCGGGTLCMDYAANDDWFGETLDLFRYSAPGVLDWTTNTNSYFSLDGGVTAYEGGYFSTGTYNGDGWQASHWKAPQLPSGGFSCAMPKLGIMNPYACSGRNGVITGLDFAALDAIGWNTNVDTATFSQSTQSLTLALAPVPEPSTWAMMLAGFGMVGFGLRTRRKQPVRVNYA
jgi:hypothetical protein